MNQNYSRGGAGGGGGEGKGEAIVGQSRSLLQPLGVRESVASRPPLSSSSFDVIMMESLAPDVLRRTRGQWPYRPAATRAMRNRHVMLYDLVAYPRIPGL